MLPWAAPEASAWGQKGHDVTAYIAEKHLTPVAADSVSALLDGRSLVYWANWLDNASHTPDYAYTKTWHYKNIDEGVAYEDAPLNEKGDVVRATIEMAEILRDSVSTRSQKVLALKILTHVVGDMHQPMHMGHLSDRGGNEVKLKYFGRETNLHSIWDGSLPESAHKWSYSEWQQQLDRLKPEAEAQIMGGTPDDWAKETYEITARVYNYFPKGSNASYNHIAYWTPVIEQQLLRGGLRLAALLNSIFDPAEQDKE
ncbi:MAG: S1/P1 nuclease [Muribaculaceae bacterium]|nr:S1/P1 nuclease [Muribaculaceae bacterium]